jgi:hypothetical protein
MLVCGVAALVCATEFAADSVHIPFHLPSEQKLELSDNLVWG